MPVKTFHPDKMQVDNSDPGMLSEDKQMIQKLPASQDSQQIQTTSNSDEMQTKDMEYNTNLSENDARNTDPMIRSDEAPTGTISSVPSLSEKPSPDSHSDMTKRQILKSVLLISFVFLLSFIACAGLAVLQSSLHVQQGMGVISLAVIHISVAVSCLTLPTIAISLLGHKWCMCVSLVGHLVWMVANGFGVWATMLPTSIIIGISAATLWTAQASYLTLLAKHYAVKTNQETAPVTSLFFGIFTAILTSCNVFASIISSTVLSRSSINYSQENQTTDLEEELLIEWCGLNDCPGSSSNTTLFTKPPPSVIWTLVGVYVSIAAIALIICCVFVDPLPKSWVRNPKTDSSNARQMVTSSLLATIKQMRHVKQLLLIPITIYLGMEQTFLEAEYTRSFVTCFLSIAMVGWCLIPASVCKSLGCFVSGRITKYTGVIPVLICGLLLDLSFQLTLWLWTPSIHQMSLFFIVPVLSALADSIWVVQLGAIYGVLFSDDPEAAFSCFQFFKACGHFLGLSYSSFLCTRLKLQILTSMLALGLSLLFVVVLVFKRKPRKPARP